MEDMHEVLRRYWGYDSFRPLQEDIIASVLDGHDTIGLMPTGGGKSLTFQVPALMLEGVTLVITPLVSLMKDQVDALRARDIPAIALHAGLLPREKRLTYDKCRLGKLRLLYLAPERLAAPSFVEELRTWHVSLIVVDEAHCISQWGYDFRPSYLTIKSLRRLFPAAPMLALTASATPQVVDDIARQLDMVSPRIFSRSFSRDNISFLVREGEDKEALLLKILRATTGSAIVYARSRARTAQYAQMLRQNGISADFYHAGMEGQDKNDKQNRWHHGQLRVLVATTAFGMGIDKPDVRLVVHVDIPSSLEEYYQEAGRAGRDGKPAYAVILANPRNRAALARHITESFPTKDFLREVYNELGVFLGVAIGEGGGLTFPFDLEAFCRRFSHPLLMTSNALSLMTRMGWLEYTGEISTQSRVMMLIPKHLLYGMELTADCETVLGAILRRYTGLYADYVSINEATLACDTSIPEQRVYEALGELRRQKVLLFIPHRVTPYIFYTMRRDEARRMVISRAVYDDRRRAMERRVNAMMGYVFDHDGCRVQAMLRYFGQDSQPCGKCDWCREHRPDRTDKARLSHLHNTILYIAGQPGGHTIEHIIDQLTRDGSEAERSLVVGLVREMVDHRELVVGDDDVVTLRT